MTQITGAVSVTPELGRGIFTDGVILQAGGGHHSHLKSFQVTVGSGRPTARQKRFTLLPSLTVTSPEMFTIRAGTATQDREKQMREPPALHGSLSGA